MKRLLVTTLVILGLTLVAAIFYCVAITKDKDTLNTELKSIQSVLTSTQVELDSTKQMLASTQAELGLTKEMLASTQVELGSTKEILASTTVELVSTKNTLTSTQSELDSTKQTLVSVQQTSQKLQDTLSRTQQQLVVAQETLEGLGITLATSKECYDVELIDNPEATNPTWSQLMTFLSQDQTEKHTYIMDEYDCSQFSRDVHNNAEAAGIRAAEVHVSFRNRVAGHALNAFLTTDYGLVYVDCTEAPDTIARVKTGKEYRAAEIGRGQGINIRNDYWWDTLSSYYYLSSDMWDGEVVTSSIIIYW